MTEAIQRSLSGSQEQTLQFGMRLGTSLHGGEVLLVEGDLGAGKTVLARGVAEALHVQGWRGSPTFALINEYSGRPALIHVDLYRLSADDVEDLGLEEYCTPNHVLLIEWADRALPYLTQLDADRTIIVRLFR